MTISEMKQNALVGDTTRELDEIGGRFLKGHGAVPAPKKTYNFSGNTCISINNEGHSFPIHPFNPSLLRLCRYTHNTMMKVISSLNHGVRLNEIGRIIEIEANKGGYNVIKNLCSHGIGKSLHEGLVITIGPFLSTGAGYVVEQPVTGS
ncbi:M24 family metallopeptidase [Paenibacillus chartarius]|uniref:M24 family metallopeptidase n=1 Tax=Paenibacillus chartarius TaxID=747481 RepID=A0ABV6DSD1_9BACL